MKNRSTFSTIIRLLGIAVALLVVTLLFKNRIQAVIASIKNRRKMRDEKKLLNDLGMSLSYPTAWYTSNAQKLYEALYTNWIDWNCNETQVIQVYNQLKNDLDFTELYLAFGTKDSYDLTQWLYSCLNQGEINTVNQLLAQKGISKRI